MDIGHQFQKIRLFLAKNGLIAVFKKMTLPSMAAIVADGVPGQQAPHDGSHRATARPEQRVKMVGDQRPSIAGCPGSLQDIAQQRKKITTILVVIENPAPLNFACNTKSTYT